MSEFVLRDKETQVTADLSDKSRQYAEMALSDNTLRAYEADWNDFAFWCSDRRHIALPAKPRTISDYISDLADYANANTISRRLSAISANHKAAGYERNNPTRDVKVKNVLAGIRRKKGTIQRGKAALLVEDIRDIARHFDDADLTGLRDKALILTGFAGAFRRSELVALDADDLSFSREGVIIEIRHSKGDQEGEGQYLAITCGESPLTCPVTALKSWMQAAGIKSGPLFRPITKSKTVRDQRLTDKSVALLVKKYAALVGLDADDFAGHSLRRGFATSAAQHDVDERDIMKQTRHKSERMVRRYIERGNLFKDNPVKKMGL